MEGDDLYWKNRALNAEEQSNRLRNELEREKMKRSEFEALVTQRFDAFCKEYEERLLTEVGNSTKSNSTSFRSTGGRDVPTRDVSSRDVPIAVNRSSHNTPMTDTRQEPRRSFTPTPRRAPPVPPGRNAYAPR